MDISEWKCTDECNMVEFPGSFYFPFKVCGHESKVKPVSVTLFFQSI